MTEQKVGPSSLMGYTSGIISRRITSNKIMYAPIQANSLTISSFGVLLG